MYAFAPCFFSASIELANLMSCRDFSISFLARIKSVETEGNRHRTGGESRFGTRRQTPWSGNVSLSRICAVIMVEKRHLQPPPPPHHVRDRQLQGGNSIPTSKSGMASADHSSCITASLPLQCSGPRHHYIQHPSGSTSNTTTMLK